MNLTKSALNVIGFISSVEALFDDEFSKEGRFVLEQTLADYDVDILCRVFKSIKNSDLSRRPKPKEVADMCRAFNMEGKKTERTDHAYNLGRKYRMTNRTGNPYHFLEMRGVSCCTLGLYFQKGYSEADTDLTLSES